MNRYALHLPGYLATGQTRCYDTRGREIVCHLSGQDAEHCKGLSWPTPRFQVDHDVVYDALTGLMWTRNASPADFPMTWEEALAFIHDFNNTQPGDYTDWRLPNRHELRSLMSHQTRMPALPDGHPFTNLFMSWYWTSTTAAIAPDHAWYVHMEGARMFYGGKDQSYMVWPVRSRSEVLPRTGQQQCFDHNGEVIACRGSGQDGETRQGHPWPAPRFEVLGQTVHDKLTGLLWRRQADLLGRAVDWQSALEAVRQLQGDGRQWRLPNINELESLVDCSRHDPALPKDHLFQQVRDGYWSSTTSAFEPDWAFALYTNKGAIGVGQKKDPHFYIWAVTDAGNGTGNPP